MSRFRSVFAVYAAIGLMLCGFAMQTNAQQTRNERDVRNIVRSLNSKVDDFRYSLEFGLRNSSVKEQDADTVENYLSTMDGKIRDFDENFNQRRENADDVTDILNAAKGINDFLVGNRVNNTVQKDWTELRALLDRLASSYNVSWSWTSGNSDNYPNSNYPTTNYPTNNRTSVGLSGTYSLDVSKSENTTDIIQNSGATTDAQRQDLESKLEAADQLAIEIRGTQVTLASSKSAPISFAADGRTKTENVGGRTIRVRATLRGQELTVSSLGGETDYTVTFASLDGGRSMKVTRRITTDYLNQTVFAESFYTKTDAVARLDINQNPSTNYPTNTTDQTDDGNYSSNDPTDNGNTTNYPTTTNSRTGNFIVPNGTIITGILENEITTKVSQNNDRFKMTVQSPNEYRGATVEGYISGINRSGKITGSSKITFNFEKITLRNGQTYEFAGYLQNVTDTNGKVIKIDTEGTAKGDSQTKETVKRGGIGAGLGAIIGAIAGGGKGAAIGAIIGGSAGAGSVVLQGKDDLELKKGSTITVTASAPNR